MANTQPALRSTKNERLYLNSFADLYEKLAPIGLVPPQAIDLEQSLLGAMMIDYASANRVLTVLGARGTESGMFYRDAHASIYRAMWGLSQKGEPIDLLTVKNRLLATGKLEKIGGPAYLVEMTNSIVTTVNVESYSRILLEKYIARELIRICEEVKLRAFEGAQDTFQLLDEAEQFLFELSTVRTEQYGRMRKLGDVATAAVTRMGKAMDHNGELTGLDTGFAELNALTGGWQDEELIVLAARPSQGKTALALNFVRSVGIDPFHSDSEDKRGAVVVFSLEMGSVQLGGRLLAQKAGIDMNRARKGQLSDEEFRSVMRSANEFSEAPVFIYDVTSISVPQIRQQSRQLAKRLERRREAPSEEHPNGVDKRLRMIVIDYLQLIDGPQEERREREIAKMTKALKQLARELHVPVVLLAQLSREVEKRQIKKPMLADLRESGSIEQDADAVIFIYRPEVYGLLVDEFGRSNEGIAEFILAKQREGPIGEVRAKFLKHSSRFEPLPVDLFDAEARFERNQPVQEVAF